MSLFNDPDDVVDALRAPATTAELADQSAVVELMANACLTNAHTSARRTSMTSISRRTRVATLIAAGVIGFGGVAAAGPGGLDVLPAGSDGTESTEETEEVGTTVSTTTDVTTTTMADDPAEEVEERQGVEVESSEEAGATGEGVAVEVVELLPERRDNPDTAFDEKYCATDEDGNELNHGKTVSAVARGDAGFEKFEVRDAAQSDCGKVGRDTAEDDLDEDVDTEGVEAEESTEEVGPELEKPKIERAESKPAKTDGNGNGNGKSNGNGNGNKNGNGNGKKSND